MSEPVMKQPELAVRIERNGERARLIIPGDFNPLFLNEAAALEIIHLNNVQISEDTKQAIREMIAQFHANPCLSDLVIAEFTPPQHGKPGRLEWEPEFDPNRSAIAAHSAPADAGTNVDHRSRTSYQSVAEGQRLATIVPPTEGVDGRDVTGRLLPAKTGVAIKSKFGPNINVAEDGAVTAAIAGLLISNKGQFTVTPVFEVPGAVDFSTGNIDFKGSVEIKEGICGRFLVRATENIIVGGLIEAATIECGGNFIARTGIAARDRGDLRVGGQAEVGFLNDVRGLIKGDLLVRREIMNCRLVVGGSVLGDAAVIIGGELSVANALRVARLGADGGTRTIIAMGGAPLLAIQIKQHRKQEQITLTRLEDLRARYDTLRIGGVSEPEKLLELKSQITACEAEVDTLARKIAEAENSMQRLAQGRDSEIQVSKVIHPQVHLRLGGVDVVFEKDLKGPLRIVVDESGRPVFRQGQGSTRPLSEAAHIAKRAA